MTEAKEHWGGICGLLAQHAGHAEWSTAESTRPATMPCMNFVEVSEEEVNSPGLDQVQKVQKDHQYTPSGGTSDH